MDRPAGSAPPPASGIPYAYSLFRAAGARQGSSAGIERRGRVLVVHREERRGHRFRVLSGSARRQDHIPRNGSHQEQHRTLLGAPRGPTTELAQERTSRSSERASPAVRFAPHRARTAWCDSQNISLASSLQRHAERAKLPARPSHRSRSRAKPRPTVAREVAQRSERTLAECNQRRVVRRARGARDRHDAPQLFGSLAAPPPGWRPKQSTPLVLLSITPCTTQGWSSPDPRTRQVLANRPAPADGSFEATAVRPSVTPPRLVLDSSNRVTSRHWCSSQMAHGEELRPCPVRAREIPRLMDSRHAYPPRADPPAAGPKPAQMSAPRFRATPSSTRRFKRRASNAHLADPARIRAVLFRSSLSCCPPAGKTSESLPEARANSPVPEPAPATEPRPPTPPRPTTLRLVATAARLSGAGGT